jgi:hypothetical protein
MGTKKGGETMHNLELRSLIRRSRVKHYEIAQELGISEYTLCRWLREPLPEEKEKLIREALTRVMRNI